MRGRKREEGKVEREKRVNKREGCERVKRECEREGK